MKTLAGCILALFGMAAFGQQAPTPQAPAPQEVKPAGGQHGAAVRTLSYKDLKFPTLPELKIPDVARFSLPNGMKLYLLENHELPLVRGTALVRTGNLFDPKDKIGIAELTGTVMRSGGTTTRTGDEIDLALENMAASVETGIGEANGSVSFSALKENTDQVLAIFKDVMTRPEFRQDKLDLAKSQVRSGISRRNDEASEIAGREIQSLIYGKDTPFGWEMNYEHVDRIQRADLVGFYQRYFTPSNIMLSVQGDFSAPEMKAKLEKLFADWTVTQPPVSEFPKVSAKPNPGVWLATKEDVTQSFLEIGHLGGTYRDKDYPALSVMSDILGGGFSSRLFKVVRTQKGLAYNISGGWGAGFSHPGLFHLSGSTKSASTVDTIEAALAEVKQIQTAEVTKEELDTAKQSVLNSFVFSFDSPAKTLNRVVTYDYYGYPKDFIFQYQKAVAAVTAADVLRVAKQYVHPEQLTIVVAGNPKEFGKPLTSFGKVQDVDLTIPEPAKATAPASSGAKSEGKALLQKAQAAVGGLAALQAVHDVVGQFDVSITGPQGALQVKQNTQWLTPGVFRQTQELPFGKIITFYDGKAGWFSSPQGVGPMPPPIVKQVQGEMFRNLIALLMSTERGDRSVALVASNTVEISEGPETARLEIGADGLPAKLSYQMTAESGPVAVSSTYSDWKDVGGVKLPHAYVVYRGSEKFAEAKATSWKENTGLKLEELSAKP